MWTSLVPTNFRTSSKGFPTGIRSVKHVSFPVTFLQWHKQPSSLGRLLSGGPTSTVSQFHSSDKKRKIVIVPAFFSSSDMPDSDRYTVRMCACKRVTTTTTTNYLGYDAKTVATTVSMTSRGRRKEGFEKPTLDNF